MKQWKTLRHGALLALGLVASSGVLATTLTHMHVDDMSGAADTVIVGKVQSQETVRANNAINTVLTVAVEDTITGQAGSTVEVLVPGGNVVSGGFRIGEVNAGVGVYGIDSELVMFLTPADAAGQRQIVGYSQGQFNVNSGMVSIPELGAPLTLDQFKARIRANATR